MAIDWPTLTATGKRLALAQLGDPYIFGPEDCSEFVFDVYGPEGLNVLSGARDTADGYYHGHGLVKVSSKALRPLDLWVLLDAGTDHAHHIGINLGDGTTIEARGHAYGTVRYALNDPVNGAIARGAVFLRVPGSEFGQAPAVPLTFVRVWGPLGLVNGFSAATTGTLDIIAAGSHTRRAVYTIPSVTSTRYVRGARAWFGDNVDTFKQTKERNAMDVLALPLPVQK
jgi:hypothetical protein